MSSRVRLALLLPVLLAAACNITTERPRPTPLPPLVATASASKPVVSISTPVDGAEVVVGTDILIRGEASDSQGVTRVQLVANDRIVRVVSAETAGGTRNMPVTLDYRPVVTGPLKLEVIAWRGSVSGEAAIVNVQVRANRSQVLATAVPQPEQPVIDPNDPTCRVLTNVPLNVRVNAGTGFERITTLASGDQIPVLARLVDDSWWQVTLRDGTAGWVAGRNPDNSNEQFVSVYGDCTLIPSLPLPQPTEVGPDAEAPDAEATPVPGGAEAPAPAGPDDNGEGEDGEAPDLVVVNLRGPDSLTIEQGDDAVTASYEVTVSNSGAATGERFRVRLDGAPDAGPFDETVNGLGAGESISFSFALEFSSADDVILVATVDSAEEISESDEENNSARLDVTIS